MRWSVVLAWAALAAAAAAQDVPQPGAALDPSSFKYTRTLTSESGLVEITLDAPALAHSRGPAGQFADLRILDASNRQLPYVLQPADSPLVIALPIAPSGTLKTPALQPERGRQSVYTVTLPVENLPASQLAIDTTAGAFRRTVRAGVERPADRWHRDVWFDVLAQRLWAHAGETATAMTLVLDLPLVDAPALQLVVDEGDNAPLPISSAHLRLLTYRLRFFASSDAPLRMVYGRDALAAPQYDLALRAPEIFRAPARESVASAESATGPSHQAMSQFMSQTTFWIVLAIAVIALLALIARLVRSSDANDT